MSDDNLVEFEALRAHSTHSATLESVIAAMARVALDLSAEISRGALAGDRAALVGENSDGDGQKALDVMADEAFMAALRNTAVRFYASEEQADVLDFETGEFGLAIDPLDGSSNIDANVSIGTIFSLVRALDDTDETFFQPARAQLAAGYFIYGPQCALVLSLGQGTHQFIYDYQTKTFRYQGELNIPETTKEFAINASNHRHWRAPIRAYVDDCLAGETGPRGMNYNMRWVASLVAETHRILSRGGVFIYPADDRDGYKAGRLRMIYEGAPIAFLIEHAGGKATDGHHALLEMNATELHQRTPLAFGSAQEITRLSQYFERPPSEIAPLFNRRGLFSQ